MSEIIEPDSAEFRKERQAFSLLKQAWKNSGFDKLTQSQRDLHFVELFWGRVSTGGLHRFLLILEAPDFPPELAAESLDRHGLGVLYDCFSDAIDLLKDYLSSRDELEEATTFDPNDFRKCFREQLNELEERFYASETQVKEVMNTLIDEVLKTSDPIVLPKYED